MLAWTFGFSRAFSLPLKNKFPLSVGGAHQSLTGELIAYALREKNFARECARAISRTRSRWQQTDSSRPTSDGFLLREARVFHSLPRGVNSGGHGDASERRRRRKKKTLTGRRNLAKLDSVRRDLDSKGREARL